MVAFLKRDDSETPSVYAERLGSWYAQKTGPKHKKSNGQFFTPANLAAFMATHSMPVMGDVVRVLDPGIGTGVLSCALCENLANTNPGLKQIEITGYEVDSTLAEIAELSLFNLRDSLAIQGIELQYKVVGADYILHHAGVTANFQSCLPGLTDDNSSYDIVIANPPYFKLRKSDSRAQAASHVVHGQPNMYALFMAVSACLLKNGGQLIFITPRSFASGLYFKAFREAFFNMMRPISFHVFQSRKEVFNKDDVLQENVILSAIKDEGWINTSYKYNIEITASNGISDLASSYKKRMPMHSILDIKGKDKSVRFPLSEVDERVYEMVTSWHGNLKLYDMEISTGPVVPFRATKFLIYDPKEREVVPLLWMQNVSCMKLSWPAKTSKAQYICVCNESMPLLLPNNNYVLLRRFSSKEQVRRLTAVPILKVNIESRYIGLENHLNYIHRPGSSLSSEEAYGLAALINCSIMDKFFRILNGNTQVNATDFRSMPLPPLSLIVNIGKRIMASEELDIEYDIDSIVNKAFSSYGDGTLVAEVVCG